MRRKSKFDPYTEEIKQCLNAGMTIQKTAEALEVHFDDVVDRNTLYAFMRCRKLQSKITQGGTNICYKAPICDQCQHCRSVIGITGDGEIRLCEKDNRLIYKSAKTSPMWCRRRNA